MNGPPDELDALLAPLRDGPVALSSAAEADARRERLLPAVRAEVERVPGRLRRARTLRHAGFGLGIGAAAAALALAVVTWLPGGAAPPSAASLHIEPLGARSLTFIDASGARSEIAAAAAITAPGELVTAPSSWSRLSTARGVQVQIAPRTRLRVTAVDERAQRSGLRLEQGEVHCRVPKLGPSEQFSIATPQANIVVHGTVFSVRVGEPDAAGEGTCVRVSEGLVEVRSRGGSIHLGPGSQWGCDGAAAEGPSRVAARAEQDRARTRSRGEARRRGRASELDPRATAGRLPDGTLDEENELLAAALAAERAQDIARARALFTVLVERHPASPLVPEARAGLIRTTR